MDADEETHSPPPNEPVIPRTPLGRNTGAIPGVTPTQQNPNYVPHQEELQGTGNSGRTSRNLRSASQNRPSSSASSSKGTSDKETFDGISLEKLIKPLEQVFNNRLSAVEDKMLRANNLTMQKMVESNTKILAEFREANSRAVEDSITTSVASGFSQLTSSVNGLTKSIEGLNKNQLIQAHLLSRLESRLDESRSSSPRRSSEGSPHRDQSSTPFNENGTSDTEEEEEDWGEGREADQEGDYGDHGDTFSPHGGKKRARKTRKELDLQENIRGWIDDLVGGRQYSLDARVTEKEAKDFEKTFNANPVAKPCTIEDFRYDIVGKPASAWNKGAAFVFIQYVEKNRLMKIPDKATRNLLQKCFTKRLRTLHKSYERSKLSQAEKVERSKLGRKYGRKCTTFHQRRTIIDSLTPLRKYLPIFDQLGIMGMSSDEEDTETSTSSQPQYWTTCPLWRGSDVDNFVKSLDACHTLVRMPNDLVNGTRYSRGAPPRFRIRTKKPSNNKSYVKALPENFYRAEWLEEQERGWAKGGKGIVNLIICPKPRKELVFPVELREQLKKQGYVFSGTR
ncbi:hypothetical protein GG344DRAFT_81188 [Lentinula edodes]|nr:hypothetical protein GG344DRAFT_81188 [Lentinula edodes]